MFCDGQHYQKLRQKKKNLSVARATAKSMSGLRYVFDPCPEDSDDFEFVPLYRSVPTVALDLPDCPTIAIIVADTVYMMHEGVARAQNRLLTAKLDNNDTFSMDLWNRKHKAMVVQPPNPYLFQWFFLHMYGVEVENTMSDDVLQKYNKLKEYMLS